MEWAKEVSKACDVLKLNEVLNAKEQGKMLVSFQSVLTEH